MGIREKLIVAFCALALFAGSNAFAQTTKESGNKKQIETIVVTAQRRSENVQNVPISVQAFTGKSLKDLGIKSSTDLTQVTPNLDIALPSGAGSQPIISIRGIGLNDYDSNNAGPNGVYLDEVYLSSPASQTFQLFDLQRVEVLKGPQGTLYGMNTSGGAINFITNKPTDYVTSNVTAAYSSYNTRYLEGAVGGPLTDKLDGRFAAVINKSTGYMNNALTGTKENGTDNYSTRGMLKFKPKDDLSMLLTLRASGLNNRPNEYHLVGTLDPNTFAPCSQTAIFAGGCVDLFGYGTTPNLYDGAWNRRQHLTVHNRGATFRVDYSPGEFNFTSLTAFTHTDRFHPEDTDAEPNRLLEIDYGVNSNTWSQEFRIGQTKSNYNWVGGLYFLRETLTQDQPLYILLDGDLFFGGPGAADGIAEIIYDHSRQVTKTYAVYGQGNYDLSDKLTLTVGGRYTTEKKDFRYNTGWKFQQGGMDNFGPVTNLPTFYSSLDDNSFNWRLALNYHFTGDILAYASIATGFKSGGFNGSFLSSDPAEIAKQLQPIKPEHVTAYELGFKSSLLDGDMIFNAALFYNNYKDMQVFSLINSPTPGNPPVNILDNAPKAHTQGVEMHLIYQPVDNFTATVNVGYLETKLDEYSVALAPGAPNYSGNVLPVAPRWSNSTILDYKVPVSSGTLDLQFSASYKSKQFFDTSNDPLTVQDAYWLENFRAGYTFDGAHWEVALFARNLSNKKYLSDSFDLSSPFGLIEQVVGVPRTYGLEVDYQL